MMKVLSRLRHVGAVAAVAVACAVALVPATAFAGELTASSLNVGTASTVTAESGISGTRYGIDVSYHNGVINWSDTAKVVDFAIIRCGYGDYNNTNGFHEDTQWRNNANGCKANGIPFGVYYYSYGDETWKAKEEGRRCAQLVNGCGNTLPVYMDVEDPCLNPETSWYINSNAELVDRYFKFVEGLNEGLYTGQVGIYSSASWWEHKLPGVNVSSNNRWVAHWFASAPGRGYSDTYNTGCGLWQYTNKASIAGVPSQNVDGNFASGSRLSGSYDTLFRLYNKWSGEHLYTMDASEVSQIDGAGWLSEGKATRVYAGNSVNVYRLYNPYSGDHHYTTSASERDSLTPLGWVDEGTSFKARNSGDPMYRLFNPYEKVGTHLYTTNKSEYDYLATIGWRQEGVAMYF